MKFIIDRLPRVLLLFISSLIILLQAACSFDDSGTSLFDDSVTIERIGAESLAPANWTFRPKTDLVLTSYQWSFSDDEEGADKTNQTAEISHTFQEPGIYTVRLDYERSAGQSDYIETQVIVRGGVISGRLLAAADNLVDIDTLEPKSSGDNNTFEKAQIISSKAQLSGIVDDRDLVDIFQVQLQKNQRLMIQMADDLNLPSEESNKTDEKDSLYNRVKLTLYTEGSNDQAANSIETVAETGRFPASLLVPEDGLYYLEVTAIEADGTPTLLNNTARGEEELSSHGIYSLIIGSVSASSSGEFVLGEVNVLLKPNRQYAAQGLRTKTDLGRFKTLSLDDARALMGSANIRYTSVEKNITDKYQQQRWEVLQAVEILSQHDDVEIAEPNWKRYAATDFTVQATSTNDPLSSSQWHYGAINLPQAWEALGNLGKKEVVVAVLDTGVLVNHPDLKGNLIEGYDFYDKKPGGDDPGDNAINNGQRSSFHGTHVAGTIAASANNGAGGTGVAPNVSILPVRVLGNDGGSVADIISGVCYAAKLDNTSAGLNGICENTKTATRAADIINLSLGGPDRSSIAGQLYPAVAAKGIIVIAAAGNKSTSAPFYPAAYQDVISVSALSQNSELASYSNYGDDAQGAKIDVAAPGGDFSVDDGILSTLGDDSSGTIILTYGYQQGTSMAAPHVAGIAALMKSIKPDLTHNEFLTYLRAGDLTQDLGGVGRDDIFGYGLIDAHKAILFIKDGVPPQLLSSSYFLFFNIGVNRLSFNLSATNELKEEDAGVLSVKSIKNADNQEVSWLSLDAVVWGENTVIVNRTGLDEGLYQADIVINSTTLGDLTIRVTLQVGNPQVSADAGVQYVVLIDSEAEPDDNGVLPTVADSDPAVANEGEYIYQIDNIKKGRYLVATGSDLDLDNSICDAGESCGQYPTLEQPKIITISEEQPYLEVNMSVNYSFGESFSQGQAFQNSAGSVKPKPIAKTEKNKEIGSDILAPLKTKAEY